MDILLVQILPEIIAIVIFVFMVVALVNAQMVHQTKVHINKLVLLVIIVIQ